MAKKTDMESPTIIRKLVIFMLLFYFIYYIVSIIFVGAFDVPWGQLGRFPFRIAMRDFNPEAGGGALGAWLAMVVTFAFSLVLAFYVIKATKRTWDYIATTSTFHAVLCCIVNQAFPVNWIWWITLIIAGLLVSLAAEFLIYYLRDLREIHVEN